MVKVSHTLVFLLLVLFSYSQATYRHPSVLGVHFTLHNFYSSSPFDNPKYMDAGLSLSYLKGLSPHFDWRLSVNGLFPDSTSKESFGGRSMLLQSDVSLRTRLIGKPSAVQPFLLTGGGLSHYKNKIGGYILFGPGLELNYRDVFFLFSAQYRLSFNKSIGSHFFYSLGIGGLLSRAKGKKVSVKALAVQQYIQRDRDGDGIWDSLDVCPDQAGIARFKGCPDTDNDGIQDKEDNCPSIFGLEKYKGCPIPDSDADGINDEEDQCIYLPGVLKYKGCPVPDRDQDGVNDEEDLCIDVPGIRENKGCPGITKEFINKIDLAAKNIFFKTGSHELLSRSFSSLDEVAGILKANPEFTLSIEGHTDNIGDENFNQLLSKGRAQAVLEYLLSKGIAKSRLSSTGYGEQRPIADNSSPKGRARNRRVEMRVQ
jgi:OmpA-OmpF porin, OOP family